MLCAFLLPTFVLGDFGFEVVFERGARLTYDFSDLSVGLLVLATMVAC